MLIVMRADPLDVRLTAGVHWLATRSQPLQETCTQSLLSTSAYRRAWQLGYVLTGTARALPLRVLRRRSPRAAAAEAPSWPLRALGGVILMATELGVIRITYSVDRGAALGGIRPGLYLQVLISTSALMGMERHFVSTRRRPETWDVVVDVRRTRRCVSYHRGL